MAVCSPTKGGVDGTRLCGLQLRRAPHYYVQISDDEDDTHPNVDTASLFKWRHEAR